MQHPRAGAAMPKAAFDPGEHGIDRLAGPAAVAMRAGCPPGG
jgi:hypothetical protein